MILQLVCSVAAAAIFVQGAGCKKQEADTQVSIKLGAILPLTGEAALYGNNTRKGIELAVDQANQAGRANGQKVVVVFEDSKALAKDGVSAAQKLITQDQVPVIFDDAVSSVALAIVPIADKAGVVVISSGSTNPDLSGKSRFFFRTWNSDSEEGRFSAEFAADRLRVRKGCVLCVDNDYGRGLADVFTRNFKAKGGEILSSESFAQNAMDFRNQLTKLKAAGGEFIYIISYPEKTPIILNQARELQLSQRFLGTVTMQDPNIPKQAGASAEGVVFPYPVEPTGAQADKFKAAFRTKFGQEPGICCPEGYDNAKLVLHCLAQGAKTGEQIRDSLRGIKDWPGASGPITFDDNGDVHKPMEMRTINHGQFVEFKP